MKSLFSRVIAKSLLYFFTTYEEVSINGAAKALFGDQVNLRVREIHHTSFSVNQSV